MKLADRLREKLHLQHACRRTVEAYLSWYLRYVRFHGLRHPAEMGESEVEAFPTDLAMRGQVAPATQNQALNALVYLYKHVLEKPLGGISALRARPRDRLPVVLTVAEVKAVLNAIPAGEVAMQARLLYGYDLRLMECLRLRIGYTLVVPKTVSGSLCTNSERRAEKQRSERSDNP